MTSVMSAQPLDDRAEIGILTVISVELEAALKAFPPLKRTKDPRSGTIFRTGTIHSELTNCDYRVVLVCIDEPGNPAAAAAATELLLKYDPRAVLLMGIAGGMRDKLKIGDVAFSERVVAYESAALTKATDGTTRVERRPDIDRTPHRMMQDVADYLARPDPQRLAALFRKMDGQFPTPPPGKEEEYAKHVASAVRAKLGTIGAGEKLMRNPDEIKALNRDVHGKLQVVAMEEVGLVNAARRLDVPWLVIRGISDFGDEFKNDDFHVFASKAAAAVLVDFLVHGIDVGPPEPPPGWKAAETVTEQWQEETRDVIGDGVRIARDSLQQKVVESLQNERVTLLLGDSGSGKSALLKAVQRSGGFPDVTLCLPAQEAAALVASYDLDLVVKAKRTSERMLLVVDGLDRVVSTEALRGIARLLRALALSSDASPWRLVLTCQTASWTHRQQELAYLNVQLPGPHRIHVEPFENKEIEQVAREVCPIAPVLLREDLRPVMGRPKILDLVACAAKEVGLPDVAQWVGESSLIQWVWNKFICGGERDARHAGLLQDIARRLADSRLFSIPVVDLDSSDRALIDDLARLGILIKRYDTIRFAHDLYADYARQRYLLALFYARRPVELKSRLTNPLWHVALRLIGLHLLEYQDTESAPDIEGWRRLACIFDERKNRPETEEDEDEYGSHPRDVPPGAGVDLLLEGITFAARPGDLLDSILDDLLASRGAMLRSFLFRFSQAAVVTIPMRDLFRPSGRASPEDQVAPDKMVTLPAYRLWSPIIEWIALHGEQVLSCAPWEFLDAAEFWLLITSAVFGDKLFQLQGAGQLARLIVDLVSRIAPAPCHYSRHSEVAQKRVRLYQVMLLCGAHERERVHALSRRLSGLEGDVELKPRPPRRSVLPPEYLPRVHKPSFWPKGPKSEPDEQFRKAALTTPGAEWLVALDPHIASEIFLALLIEVRDPDRETDRIMDRGGFHFDLWHYERPPFWDFSPAAALLSKDKEVGIEFIIQVSDFATDRWAERWPHVPHAGAIFEQPAAEVPKLKLIVGGVEREYVGDARVLEWHQGGCQGPDTVAAVLMALEHWLYRQDEKGEIDPATIARILETTHSVAAIGVLLELALKNPAYLFGPLEPLVACAEIYWWGRHRGGQVDVQTAMFAWIGEPQPRVKAAYDWYNMPHRRLDFLKVVVFLLAQRVFDWPVLDKARQAWSVHEENAQAARLQAWVRDVLLCNLDRQNWHFAAQPDGYHVAEYAHPEDIDQRQAAARRAIEEETAPRYFPFRCRRILNREDEIDEQKLLEMLDFASTPLDRWTQDDVWLIGGAWTPRCGAAAVAVLKFDVWLGANPKWRDTCRAWMVDACRSETHPCRPDPSVIDRAWDSFCAEALPVLWARSPGDKDLRRSLAHLVAAPHQDARRRLFTVLAGMRATHPEDFARLLHLSVWTARLATLDPGPIPGIEGPDVGKAFNRLANDFVRGRLAPLPASWVDIFEARPAGLAVNPYGEWDGFEDSALLLSFAWLTGEARTYPDGADREFLRVLVEGLATVVPRRLLHAHEEEPPWGERHVDPESLLVPVRLQQTARMPMARKPEPGGWLSRRIAKVKALAGGAVKHVRRTARGVQEQKPPALPAAPLRRSHRIGTPGQSDYEIAKLSALYLVREPDAGVRRKMWEPWLRLKGPCHHWVDLLLDYIYIAAAAVDERVSQFPVLMRDIFEHDLADGGWLQGRSRQSHEVSDVGRAFLGFGDLAPGRDFWTADRAPSALALSEYWPRWADIAISWYRCASSFLRMLRTPAFALLRPSCLLWLSRTDRASWIDGDEARPALVRLLEVVWEERHAEGHDLVGPVRDLFERLLGELVARRVADAVQLSARVARAE